MDLASHILELLKSPPSVSPRSSPTSPSVPVIYPAPCLLLQHCASGPRAQRPPAGLASIARCSLRCRCQPFTVRAMHHRRSSLSHKRLLLLLFAATLPSAAVRRIQAQPVPGLDGSSSSSSSSASTSVLTVVIRTGAQLAAAFANNSVQVALIPADVALVENDWAPYAQPFVELHRNFTLLGTFSEQERWPTVDFGYNSALSPVGVGSVRSAKVRLMPGVTLTFRHIVVGNALELPHFQFMGSDLITASPPPPEGQAWPVLQVDEGGLWQRACLRISLNNLNVARSFARHPQFPGTQSAAYTVATSPAATADCTNSAAVPAMERCWPAGRGVYNDVAVYASSADANMRQVQAGYALRFYNSPFFCDVLMSDECVDQNGGYIGCFFSIYPYSYKIISETAPPPPATGFGDGSSTGPGRPSSESPGSANGSTEEAAGNGGGSSRNVLGPVLGGALGGVVLLAGIAAVLLVLVRRRRRNGHASGAQQGKHTAEGPPPQEAGYVKEGASSCAMYVDYASLKLKLSGPCTAGSSNWARAGKSQSSDAASEAAIRMLADAELALVPVTPLTPLLPGIPLDVKMGQGGGEVMLLPVVLGKGSYGRVVEGLYGGVRVAVKLLNRGLMADMFGEGLAVVVGGPLAAARPAQRQAQDNVLCSLQEPPTAGGDQLCSSVASVAVPGGGSLASQPPTPAAAEASATSPPLLATPQQPGAAPPPLLPAQTCTLPPDQPHPAPGSQATSGPELPQTTPAVPPTPASLLPAPVSDPLLQLQQQLTCTPQPLPATAQAFNLASLLWDSTGESTTAVTSILPSTQLTAAHSAALAGVDSSTGTCGAGPAVPAAAAGPGGVAVTLAAAALLEAAVQGVGEVRLERVYEPEEESVGVVLPDGQPPSLRSTMRRTLAQEVEVLARMQHPNIIRLLAANLSPHSPCLVMERMDTSLDRVLHGGRPMAAGAGPMPLDKVLHIALHVARALAYLHPTIIHRDLKPGNVLLSNPGSPTPKVKLADFGLSRLQDTVLVTARVDVGTAPYMAPETLDVHNCVITHHSDMYSYGIMLWEMLAGERPWQGLNMVQIAYVVTHRSQQLPLSQLSKDRCPSALRALMQQCWDPVPERRPGASEVVKRVMVLMAKERASAPGGPVSNGSTRDS